MGENVHKEKFKRFKLIYWISFSCFCFLFFVISTTIIINSYENKMMKSPEHTLVLFSEKLSSGSMSSLYKLFYDKNSSDQEDIQHFWEGYVKSIKEDAIEGYCREQANYAFESAIRSGNGQYAGTIRDNVYSAFRSQSYTTSFDFGVKNIEVIMVNDTNVLIKCMFKIKSVAKLNGSGNSKDSYTYNFDCSAEIYLINENNKWFIFSNVSNKGEKWETEIPTNILNK